MTTRMKAAAALLAAMICACAPAAPDPVAWFSMDALSGAGTIADRSGNGRTLTLVKGCTLTNEAVSGSALYIDGTEGAMATFPCPSLGARTIAFWVRRAENEGPVDPSVNTYPHLFSQMSTMRALYTHGDAGGVTIYVGGKSVTPPSSKPNMWTYATPMRWTHLAYAVETWSGAGANETVVAVSMYENGLYLGSTTNTTTASASVSETARLGNGTDGTRPLHGILDEVKVWDETLSAGEILDEFNSYGHVELLGWWPMDALETGAGGAMTTPSETGTNALVLAGVTLTNGVDGSALWFDGLEGTCGTTSYGTVVPEYTFAAWVYLPPVDPSTILPGNSYPRLFGMGAAEYVYFAAAPSSTQFQVRLAGSGENLAPGLVAKGRWSHYAIAVHHRTDGSGVPTVYPVWYVDGSLMGTGTVKVTEGKTVGLLHNYTFYVGGYGSRPTYGALDDVRFYRGALSADQIRSIAGGAAEIDAGEAFAISGPRAVLQGSYGLYGRRPLCAGAEGETLWTLVSAPAGGEAAAIVSPRRLVTEALLPVEGEYVFRLAQTSFAGTAYDTVTVTRADAEAVTVPSVSVVAATDTVAIPAPVPLAATAAAGDGPGPLRLRWEKASGPGGLYFEPQYGTGTKALATAAGEYAVRCIADDGAACATGTVTFTATGAGPIALPTDTLAAYWPFDSFLNDTVSGTALSLTGATITNAAPVGYGLCASAVDATVASGVKLPVADGNSVSMWLWPDATDDGTNFAHPLNAGNLDIQWTPNLGKPAQGPYVSITLYDADNRKYIWTYERFSSSLAGGYPTNRWVHLAFTCDQTAGTVPADAFKTRMALYVDGQSITPTGYSPTTNESGSVVFLRKASNTVKAVLLGSGTVSGGIGRYFPGVMDEVRWYTNCLTAAQVARLALDAGPVNRPPILELGVDRTVRATARRSVALAACVHDDGLPADGSLSGKWELLQAPVGASVALPEGLSGPFTASACGTYVIRAKATDGRLASYSPDVTVTVFPEGFKVIVR